MVAAAARRQVRSGSVHSPLACLHLAYYFRFRGSAKCDQEGMGADGSVDVGGLHFDRVV